MLRVMMRGAAGATLKIPKTKSKIDSKFQISDLPSPKDWTRCVVVTEI